MIRITEENPMRGIRIEKVTLNVGCAADPQRIERGKKLLEYLTGRKPLVTKSKRRSTFGVAKGKPVGVKVTLRKKEAVEFLKKALEAVDKKLKTSNFDDKGNFSFGIKEYIEIPGVKYSHEVGMMGLDVCVTLERPGFRIKRRKIQKRKIPKKQEITKEETMEWVKSKLGVEVVEDKSPK
ncbi:MAG: 50S ribosomal protein L5 [Candidatus Aenigmatarchaeota archaeon]